MYDWARARANPYLFREPFAGELPVAASSTAMRFDVTAGVAVLKRTPRILSAWLVGLPDAWSNANEGPETWSAFDIVGHLIHGERTDWIPRARIILAQGEDRTFAPFDRFAQFDASRGLTMPQLLATFASLRAENLATLASWNLTPAQLALTGTHPALGSATLEQLLATWVTHDLNHLAQMARVMAGQYRDAVGPWREYLSILER